MDAWIDASVDGWMGGWMDRETDGWHRKMTDLFRILTSTMQSHSWNLPGKC